MQKADAPYGSVLPPNFVLFWPLWCLTILLFEIKSLNQGKRRFALLGHCMAPQPFSRHIKLLDYNKRCSICVPGNR